MKTLGAHETEKNLLATDGLAGAGLDDITIKEVLGLLPATALMHGEDTLLGIITFRSKMVPVVDLRLQPTAPSPGPAEEQICILAAETRQDQVPLIFGALVDSEMDAYELVMSTTH